MVLGGLLGALAYALVYPLLEPVLIRPLNYGRHSLPDFLGVNPVAMGLLFGAALIGVVFLIDRWEKRAREGARQAYRAAGCPRREPAHVELECKAS